MDDTELFSLTFREATLSVVFQSMAEGMCEVREDDREPDAAGYITLIANMGAYIQANAPLGQKPLTMLMHRWHQIEHTAAWVDIREVAESVLENCIDNGSGLRPHQADRDDPDYDPQAEEYIYAGDVTIESVLPATEGAP